MITLGILLTQIVLTSLLHPVSCCQTMSAASYSLPLPKTCKHRFSNASTIRSATFGSTAWLAMRCSGFTNANARSMVSSVGPKSGSASASASASCVDRSVASGGVRRGSSEGLEACGERGEAGEKAPCSIIGSELFERWEDVQVVTRDLNSGVWSDAVAFPASRSDRSSPRGSPRREVCVTHGDALERPARHPTDVALLQPAEADAQLRLHFERLVVGLPPALDGAG